MNLEDLTIAVHRLMVDHDLPHGFGGALALNLYTDPRHTEDIDLSAFVPWDRRHDVIPLFGALGFHADHPLDELIPVAGVRLSHPDTNLKIDVFFALDDAYERVRERLALHPFGADRVELPFFSAEDIALFKVSFNRDKDWVDLRHMIRAGTPLDLDYLEDTLVAIRGPQMYPRIARLRAMVAAGGEELR
jgi:hypothetical protein